MSGKPAPPPKVSVLMAVHNGEGYLAHAVESILNQTRTDFEYIIVDDASTDSTPEILKRLDDLRVVTLRNPTNQGLTRSLNRGLEAARGEYIARMDADDWSHPERLTQQVAFLDTHPEVVLLGTQYALIDSAGRWLGKVNLPTSPALIRRLLAKANCFGHGTVMFRREAAIEIGGYREGFRDSQDYDLWLRLTEGGEAANLPVVLYHLRVHANAKSVRHQARQQAFHHLAQELAKLRAAGQDDTVCYEQKTAAIDKGYVGPPPAREQRRAQSTHSLRLGFRYWTQRHPWLSLKHTARGLLLGPLNPNFWGQMRRLTRSGTETEFDLHFGSNPRR